MLKLVLFLAFLGVAWAAPGFGHGYGFGPIIAAPSIIAHPPIVKTIIPLAPATSYVNVVHSAPIVKTILAPQPVFKSYPIALSPWH